MIYHGHVENGHVILDDAIVLPEGARVRVDIAGNHDIETAQQRRDQLNHLRKRLSTLPVGNLPDGLSNRDHDRILYGEPS